jgi:hypothetical protein
MIARYSIGLVLLAGMMSAADTVTPLDLRPGLWEGTTTIERNGTPPIPPELLSRMTPEQKAELEARIKAGPSQGSQTNSHKQCVTKQDLQKPFIFGQDNGLCQRTVVSASSSKQEFRIACSGAIYEAAGIVRVEAIDREHVKFTSEVTSGDGPHPMKIKVTGLGKWVGEACTSDLKK